MPATLRLTGSGVNAVGGGLEQLLEGEVCLFLHIAHLLVTKLPSINTSDLGKE